MRFFLCLITLLVLTLTAQASANPRALTLDEFKSLVQQSSHRLRAMKLRKNAAEIAIDVETQNLWPSLKAKGGYQYEKNSNTDEEFVTRSLELSYDIFDLHARYKVKEAQAEHSLQKLRFAHKQFQIESETEVNFYRLLFLDKKLVVLDEHIKRTDSQLSAVKKRVRSGKAAKSDVLSFELELTELATDRKSLQRERYVAKKRLLIDVHEMVKDFEPKGELPHYHLEETRASITKQISNSFPVRRKASQQQKAHLHLSTAKAKRLPKLGVTLEGGYLDPDFSIEPNRSQVEGRVHLTWNLFPDLLNSSERKKDSTLAKASEVEREHAVHVLHDEIESVVNELKSIQDRVDADFKKIGLAKRLYKEVTKEYRRGVKSNEDVKAASTAIYSSQVSDFEGRLAFVELVKGLESKLGHKIKVSSHK